jgi:hypothetical protein
MTAGSNTNFRKIFLIFPQRSKVILTEKQEGEKKINNPCTGVLTRPHNGTQS